MIDSFSLSIPCEVVGVIDGDTIEVEVRRKMRIRLIDCWCPEARTKDLEEKRLGLAAKGKMIQLSLGKEAKVEIPIGGDKFGDESLTMGRILGRVIVDGKDLSELMVESGHATKTKGGK